METVAARDLPPSSPRPLAPSQINGGVDGKGSNSALDDQAERLRLYEEDLRKRRQKSEQRAKEQEFLRYARPAHYFVCLFTRCRIRTFLSVCDRTVRMRRRPPAPRSSPPALSDCAGDRCES